METHSNINAARMLHVKEATPTQKDTWNIVPYSGKIKMTDMETRDCQGLTLQRIIMKEFGGVWIYSVSAVAVNP